MIQEYLQVMCIENATFLAERMVASFRSTNAWYLLGVCHFRSNAPQRALSVLENNLASLKEHPPTAYLMAKCCFQLQQFGRAEEVLLEAARADYKDYKGTFLQNHENGDNSDKDGPLTMDEWLVETSPCPIPNGAAGLYLLGNVCRRSNRKRRAMEYFRMSLQVRQWMENGCAHHSVVCFPHLLLMYALLGSISLTHSCGPAMKPCVKWEQQTLTRHRCLEYARMKSIKCKSVCVNRNWAGMTPCRCKKSQC